MTFMRGKNYYPMLERIGQTARWGLILMYAEGTTDISAMLLEHAPAAVAILDRDMRFLDVSKYWLKIYQLDRSAVIGRSHYAVLPDLPERWKEVHTRCLAGASEQMASDQFIDGNGKVQWRRWAVRPWRRTFGEIGGIIIFTEDITERKQLESNLATSVALLNAVYQASPDGILVVDETASVVSLNTTFIKMWSIPLKIAESRIDSSVLQHVLDQVADPVAFSARVKYLYDHPMESSTDEILLRDGRVYERYSISITHFDGQYLGRVWFFRDITVRKQAVDRRARALEQTIQAVADIIEMRDPYTAGHGRQVAAIASEIAREMGLNHDRIHGLHLASLVHDLGKIGVPADILNKPGRLTDIEHQLIQGHVQIGHNALKPVEFPWPIADIILQHHERHDGSGYPNALAGEAILLEARILGVADVVDSMMSHRPYRPALGLEAALAEIKNRSGELYDTAVAAACEKVMRKRFPILQG